MEEYLQELYYDPKRVGSFGGAVNLYRAVKQERKKTISHSKIKKWLETQDPYTLHKPVRKHFKRNTVLVDGIDSQWQIDLVDMHSLSEYNDGVNYLLTCFCVFSKFAFVQPLHTKSASSLVKALDTIFQSSGRIPEVIFSDKGTEFNNKLVKKLLEKNDVKLVLSQNETKASVIERFNRTLKTKMYKYFTAKRNLRYIDVLPQLVTAYNNTLHNSIKMKPSEVNSSNDKQVWEALYAKNRQKIANK